MQLIYFADPMCSWCWGFAPVLERLVAVSGGRAELRIVMGGLRAYNTEPMNEEQRAYISGHWARVNELTGQPFNHAFFEREHFVYDTEPACRAVVTVRGLAPDHQYLMLERLHRAFYLENQDVTDASVLAVLAGEIGLEVEAFCEAFELDATREATKIDFVISQKTGITGFPTLLLGRPGENFEVVTAGYSPLEKVEPRLKQLFDKFSGAAATPS